MLKNRPRSGKDTESENSRHMSEDLAQADPEPLILALEFLAIIASVSQLAISAKQVSVDLRQRSEEQRQRIHEQLTQLDESYAAVETAARQFESLLDFYSLREEALRIGQLRQMLTANETTEFIRLYHYITTEQKRLVLGTIRLSELSVLESAEAQAMEDLKLEVDRRIQAALRASTYGRYMVEIGTGLSQLDRAIDLLSHKYSYGRHLPTPSSGQGRP